MTFSSNTTIAGPFLRRLDRESRVSPPEFYPCIISTMLWSRISFTIETFWYGFWAIAIVSAATHEGLRAFKRHKERRARQLAGEDEQRRWEGFVAAKRAAERIQLRELEATGQPLWEPDPEKVRASGPSA